MEVIMKRFFALIISILFCTESTPRGTNSIPTVANYIHTLMESNTTCEINPTDFNQATINQSDENGWTLLSCALRKGFYELARELEANGAAIRWAVIHALDHDNAAALVPVLDYILQHTETVDFTLSSDGYTPLSYALTLDRKNVSPHS